MKKDDMNQVDQKGLNEVIRLSSKILKVVYFMIILGIIFFAILLVQELGLPDFVITILKVSSPFFIGFIIAWLFNPIVTKLQDKGVNRILATILVYVVLLILIYLFLVTLVPTIYNQLNDFVKTVPDLMGQAETTINNILNSLKDTKLIDVESVQENVLETIQAYGGDLTKSLPNLIISWVGSIFSGLGIGLLSLIIGFYMTLEFNNISNHLINLLPKKHRFEYSTLLTKIGVELRKVVNGIFSCATLVFIVASIGFAIVGLKSPILFGLVCGITDLIPYIGPFIGGSVAVLVGFSQGPVVGILVLIIVIIVQQLENILIQPLVMSRATKLHPVTVMIGLLVFGNFFGIVGMILATPIISLSKILWIFIVEKFNLFDYQDYELKNEEQPEKTKKKK